MLNLSEDKDHHHQQANSDCYREVGNGVRAIPFFESVEDKVNEVGNQNGNHYN